jgi:hypothetical protein
MHGLVSTKKGKVPFGEQLVSLCVNIEQPESGGPCIKESLLFIAATNASYCESSRRRVDAFGQFCSLDMSMVPNPDPKQLKSKPSFGEQLVSLCVNIEQPEYLRSTSSKEGFDFSCFGSGLGTIEHQSLFSRLRHSVDYNILRETVYFYKL